MSYDYDWQRREQEERESKARASRRMLEDDGYTSTDGTFYENPNNYKMAFIDGNGEVHREM